MDTTNRDEMRRLLFSRIATGLVLAGYWILLFVLTHIPPAHLPGPPDLSDKAAHLLAYGGLGTLATWFLAVRGSLNLRNGLILLAVLVGYGMVDELTQGFIPYRQPDVYDWLFDALGAVIGISLMSLIANVFRVSQPLPSVEG